MVTSPIGMKMHCEKSVTILGGGNAMVLNAVSTESASSSTQGKGSGPSPSIVLSNIVKHF